METVVDAAVKNDIQPDIFAALIRVESQWTPDAVSRCNAVGLTQVLPKYTGNKKTGVPKYTAEELKDPTTSIEVGAQTFAFWLHKYARGNLTVALCGYNAGYRCKGKEPNAGGMRYARKVLKTAKNIRRMVAKQEREAAKQERLFAKWKQRNPLHPVVFLPRVAAQLSGMCEGTLCLNPVWRAVTTRFQEASL